MARVIRYALGDADVSPDPRAAPKTWWVAAARARWPREDLDERLSALGLSVDWPDVLRPATYRWGIREQTTTQFGKSHTRTFLEICVDPPLLGLPEEHPPHGRVLVRRLDESMLGRAGRVLRHTVYRVGRGAKLMGQRILAGRVDLGVAFPTALHHQTGRQWWNNFGTQTPWMVNWLASTWPHNPDGFFARGVTAMVERIDMNDSTLDPTHAYLESLFEPERPWTGMAVLALTVGMASKEADCRRLATDALIEGIEDGRAHPAGLGHTLDGLTDKGWLKVNRVAESLSEVARVSPLHQLVVAQTLETFLATRGEMPRNVHLLLELLNELLAALDRNLPTATRERLQRVKGGSKTAKLAVLLASRTGEEVGRGEREAVALALRTRLERARRMTVRR